MLFFTSLSILIEGKSLKVLESIRWLTLKISCNSANESDLTRLYIYSGIIFVISQVNYFGPSGSFFSISSDTCFCMSSNIFDDFFYFVCNKTITSLSVMLVSSCTFCTKIIFNDEISSSGYLAFYILPNRLLIRLLFPTTYSFIASLSGDSSLIFSGDLSGDLMGDFVGLPRPLNLLVKLLLKEPTRTNGFVRRSVFLGRAPWDRRRVMAFSSSEMLICFRDFMSPFRSLRMWACSSKFIAN